MTASSTWRFQYQNNQYNNIWNKVKQKLGKYGFYVRYSYVKKVKLDK